MGSFFANPHHPNTETQKLQSRLSPRWGIHKVQQMKTKRFQLPLAAGNGSDWRWGDIWQGFRLDMQPPSSTSSTLFLQCHLSSAAHISIQANMILSKMQLCWEDLKGGFHWHWLSHLNKMILFMESMLDLSKQFHKLQKFYLKCFNLFKKIPVNCVIGVTKPEWTFLKQ